MANSLLLSRPPFFSPSLSPSRAPFFLPSFLSLFLPFFPLPFFSLLSLSLSSLLSLPPFPSSLPSFFLFLFFFLILYYIPHCLYKHCIQSFKKTLILIFYAQIIFLSFYSKYWVLACDLISLWWLLCLLANKSNHSLSHVFPSPDKESAYIQRILVLFNEGSAT
jgi:hypothetical protein